LAAPQVDEIALAKMLPHACCAPFLFPKQARTLLRRYVMLDGLPPRAAAEWIRKYVRLLQVATIHAPGRRLLLKNPANLARVRLLLEVFPDARFIHVHRSPYEVFPAARELHRTLLSFTSLQEQHPPDVEENVYALYEDMMRRYLDERRLVPAGSLVEVRFQDLARDPLGTLRGVYDGLGLRGYEQVAAAVRTDVETPAPRPRSDRRITPAEAARIERRWGFAFDALGYARIADVDVCPEAA
jgi:hypothetical protein